LGVPGDWQFDDTSPRVSDCGLAGITSGGCEIRLVVEVTSDDTADAIVDRLISEIAETLPTNLAETLAEAVLGLLRGPASDLLSQVLSGFFDLVGIDEANYAVWVSTPNPFGGGNEVTFDRTVAVPSDVDSGRAPVSLAAVGGGGGSPTSRVVEVPVQAGNERPTASFTYSPSAPASGPVRFDASGSSDDGTIAAYRWQFGDGTSATGDRVTHRFDDPGTYEVTLTVTDDDGATSTTTRRVTVVSDGGGGEAGVSVGFSPSTVTVEPDGSRTVAVRATGVDEGVGSYDLTVTVADPSAATITDAESSGSPTVDATSVANDGASATFRAAGADTADSGTATIGRVTVAGAAEGRTRLSLDVSELGSEANAVYRVTDVTDATVTVGVAEAGPVVTGDRPATDTDGDGRFEDVNGDGSFSIIDVAALLEAFGDATVQSNAAAFDFDGSGSVSILDVATLLDEL
jgi:PKD repeat protein